MSAIGSGTTPPATTCERGLSGHPLEMIPFFRRWPRSFLRDVIYTAIWNTLFAVAFTALALIFDWRAAIWPAFVVNFVFAQCIGFAIYLLFVIADHLIPDLHERSLKVRVLVYAGIPIIGVFLGYPLAPWILGHGPMVDWIFSLRGFVSVTALSLLITGILLMIFIPRERAARAEAAIAREQARISDVEKEATRARMQLLEAQVEPHFLFNTLAHVVSTIDHEPKTAKRMLDRLIALLRASATAADGPGTLGAQLELLRAYLEILELRMGARLQWHIEASSDAKETRVPPMLLQPLVENAVKHGLEPKIEGGRIDIDAQRERGDVILRVRDTGLGVRAARGTASTGTGLANLRARLVALYGARASLTIEDNAPSGASVTVRLPAT